MLPCSEGECNNYVWISIVSITTQSILYQLDCARYYKIRQTIVLILRPSEHAKTSTSKRYISRSTCLKFNLKTVLNSDNHGGSNSKTAALIITLAKSVLSPLAAPLCSVAVTLEYWKKDLGDLFNFHLACSQVHTKRQLIAPLSIYSCTQTEVKFLIIVRATIQRQV